MGEEEALGHVEVDVSKHRAVVTIGPALYRQAELQCNHSPNGPSDTAVLPAN